MLLIGELIHEMTDKEFSPEELANSNRIFKSATPKYDWSWWIKWFGSIAVLIAVSIRSTGLAEFILYDLLGNQVHSIANVNAELTKIETNQLSNGIYIFSFKSNGKTLRTGKLTNN